MVTKNDGSRGGAINLLVAMLAVECFLLLKNPLPNWFKCNAF